MDENKEKQLLDLNLSITIHNFVHTLKRLVWLVLLLSFAVSAITYIRYDRAFVPKYSASAVVSVDASISAVTDMQNTSIFMNNSMATQLSASFPLIIVTEDAKMQIQLEMGRNTDAIITATATANAGLFTITSTSSNPQDAYDALCAVITVYPQIAGDILGDTKIDIINQPSSPPTEPINQNEALMAALTAFVVVALLCLFGVFLLSLLRKTIHSAEDLRKLVNLKCLTYVPKIKLKKHSNQENLKLTIKNPRVSSSFIECIRNLRVKLQKILPSKDGCKVLMITSTLPNEGKTTVATNLALSLADEGKRVLLVDGDLRKQSLKNAIGITEKSVGLVEILSGKTDRFHLLTVPKSTLMVLCGDKTTDRPQVIIDTPKTTTVINRMRETLDYVIIDTPPAGILSDAATFGKYADATLYVVRQDLANSAQILNSIQALSASNVNIIGCVLNQAQVGTTRYGYTSKYNEKYGYGYKYSNRYGYYGNRYSRYSRYSDPEEAAEVLSMDILDAVQNED